MLLSDDDFGLSTQANKDNKVIDSHPVNECSRPDVSGALIESINRLSSVIEVSLKTINESVQALSEQQRILNKRLCALEDSRTPLVSSVPSQRSSSPVRTIRDDPPPPPPTRTLPRGSLFAPPMPAGQRSFKTDSEELRESREELPVVSAEETRKKRAEEEAKRMEAERQRLAAERQRRVQLEQKTKTFMSSLLQESGSGKPGLFDDDTTIPQAVSNPRNPLFDC